MVLKLFFVFLNVKILVFWMGSELENFIKCNIGIVLPVSMSIILLIYWKMRYLGKGMGAHYDEENYQGNMNVFI